MPYVQINLHTPVSSTSLVIDIKATDEEIICSMVTFLLYSTTSVKFPIFLRQFVATNNFSAIN